MKDARELTYLSYLLRLWRDDPGATWRASLQSAITGEVRKFADAEQIWAYLNAQMGGRREESRSSYKSNALIVDGRVSER
jgi:hypothetical protein